MSLSFQKLNGSGTIAGAILEARRMPEIEKIAIMCNPDKILTPVWKIWAIEPNSSMTLNLPLLGVFFGSFNFQVNLQNVKNSSISTAQLIVKYNNKVVFQSFSGIVGTIGSVRMPSMNSTINYIGFADTISLNAYLGSTNIKSVRSSFTGFQVT